MTEVSSSVSVAKLRQKRRAKGMTETNVWLPEVIRDAIIKAVEDGEYPSRQYAIQKALEKEFLKKTGT